MTSTHEDKTTEYLFDSGSDLGLEHLTYLGTLLDARSVAMLEPIGVQPGHRCLEVGAGTGSIARWLAARAGRTGKVVACDIDTTRLESASDLDVVSHDIPPLEVISAPSPADAELFQRVQHTSCYVVGPASGMAFDWAPTLDDHLVAAGLENVHTEKYAQTTTGGGAGCRLHANLNRQAETPLVAAGGPRGRSTGIAS